MGQAKLRGSFEQRKAAAVELARVRDEAAPQTRMEKRAQREQELREAEVRHKQLVAANPGAVKPRNIGRTLNRHSAALAVLALGSMMALDHPESSK